MIGKVVSGERRNIYEIKAQTKKQKAFDYCDVDADNVWPTQIGRASCRERV